MTEPDLHGMEPEAFLEEVHSFQFWLDAVEGYLPGTRFGHRPETRAEPVDGEGRERLVGVLCNYLIGETAALEGAAGLIPLAPDRRSKVFLATQVVDEARHVEVFMRRLETLGVADPEDEARRRGNPDLVRFKRRLLELVQQGDWAAGLFAQNVILEAMEFAVFHQHLRSADAVTKEVLEGVLKDERRHMGFGENALGRQLLAVPELRPRLREVRQELDHLVLRTFEHAAAELDMPAVERQALGASYVAAVERLELDR